MSEGTGARFGSDLIVDALVAHGIKYVALNPGASFRGLHDSLVNHGKDDIEIILCQSENTAIAIAEGFAKAQSPARPMAAGVHNIVGLLNGARQTYIGFIDRLPVIILGGTGPLNEAKRRPRIDWHHTANVQGNAVRDFVKWDDQPATADSIADSFGRAYRIATNEPAGPVYLCYDAGIQEDLLPEGFVQPEPRMTQLPTQPAADADVLERIADKLMSAERPVIIAEFLGRNHDAARSLVELAEMLAIPVVDMRTRPNFPTCHPLNMSGSDILADADVILALDCKHANVVVEKVATGNRQRRSLIPDDVFWMEIGFGDLEISKWATDYDRFRNPAISVLADTSLAVPALAALLRKRVDAAGIGDKVAARAASIATRHRELRDGWLDKAKVDWDASPMTTGRLALEVWDAIKDEDWVLTSGTLAGQALKLWDFDQPYRHPGNPRGPATQIGMSLGVALAHKGTGRLVVDLQPDGDLMYDAGALWVAAKHEIPMLVVMFNNRAYYQDWMHQTHIAEERGTPVERAAIGQDITNPDPDFAGLARSMGCWGEGPIEDPAELGPALRRAIEQVKQGKLAVVDAVTRFR